VSPHVSFDGVKVTSPQTHVDARGAASLTVVRITALVAGAALTVHALTWVPGLQVVWRSVGVPPIQSFVLMLLGLAMLQVSLGETRHKRMVSSAIVLAAALFLMCLLPLPFEHVGQNFMGDGQDFAGSREKFEINIPVAAGRPELHLKAHLGDALVAVFDRAFGPDSSSAARAYEAISRVGGLLYIGELALVLGLLRASRRACRFVALALAAPVAIGFFGYYDFGYLAVSGAAFPLLILGSRLRRARLTGSAGALQGVHAALHGFGLLGIASGLAAVAVAARTWRDGVRALLWFGSMALVAYLGWFVVYRLAWNASVVRDPASTHIALRGWSLPFYFDRRIVHPLTSFNGAAEVGVTSLAVGVPVLLLAALTTRRAALTSPALGYAAPGLLFLVAWWPTLGVNKDMDLLLGAFAGIMAAAWVCSRRNTHTAAALAVLAAVHVAFWAGVADRSLSRIWLGE
jgi:hypothetical protein